MPGPPIPADPDGPFYKTRMCKAWQEGHCNFGDKCRYAHGDNDLRAAPREAPRDDFGNRSRGQGPSPQGGPMHTERREVGRKTRLCDKFMATGRCNYNPCVFAHGTEELQQPLGREGRDGSQSSREGTGQVMKPSHAASSLIMPDMFGLPHTGMMHMGAAGVGMLPGTLQLPLRQPGATAGGSALGTMPTPPHLAMLPPPPQLSQQLPRPPPLLQHQHKQQHQAPSSQPAVASKPLPSPRLQQLQHCQPNSQQHPAAAQQAVPSSTPKAASILAAASLVPHGPRAEVSFVDRVRAVCGILNIGNAATLSKDKPAALQACVVAMKNGSAFRENPFSDDVERYIQKA